jgi:UDP-GlcNAc:undecaprenyl-phosphate GlcNAc-1-phosphate transferase
MSPITGLLLIGLPLLDTAMVIVGRLLRGGSPFSADRTHIHHRFLDLGFDHYEAVFFIYLAQAVLVVSAVVLRYQSDAILFLVFMLFASMVLVYFWLAPAVSWLRKSTTGAPVSTSAFTRAVEWLSRHKVYVRMPEAVAILVVAMTFVTAALLSVEVPVDVTVMGSVLLVIYGLWLQGVFAERFPWVEKIVIYSACAICVYLISLDFEPFREIAPLLNGALVILAVVVMVGIRFGRGHGFGATPLDFLILFTALVVPNLHLEHFDVVGAAIAKLIMLFYGIEFALGRVDRAPWVLRGVTLGTLATLVLRGLS